MRPSPDQLPTKPQAEEPAAPAPVQQLSVKLGPMDYMKDQKRITFDELKVKLSEVAWKEEGVPGSSSFDSYADKLEKNRNERLKQQEDETKKMLKQVNKGRGGKKEKKKDKKEKGEKGVKRTADG